MLLHTPVYLLFLLCVALLYWVLPWPAWRKGWLLASSYAFYALFDWRFAALLLVLSLVTYLLGRAIYTGWHARQCAGLSVVLNLGALGAFKYANFFLGSLAGGLNAIGVNAASPGLLLLLPVGISFYTFQAISYTTEIARKKIEPAASFMDFAVYMAFFPKLIAGPLVRPGTFLRQLHAPQPRPDPKVLQSVLGLLVLGLVKKLLIADSLASLGEAAFRAAALSGGAAGFNTPLYIQGFYLYAFQIYADFSGYTDLARASARLLGFDLPENFQQPYLAATLISFWNRWHMSLTQWFREYLYFPLSRSLLVKSGRRYPRLVQTGANLVTMGLIGLWHGAAWTYIAWGLWHGVLLSLENISGHKPAGRWKQLLSGVVTFHLVGVGWVLFRAESFQAAGRFLRGLLAFQQMSWLAYYLPSILLTGGLVFAIDLVSSGSLKFPARLRQAGQPILTVAALVIIVNLILLALAHGVNARPFIYGQF